MALRHLALLIDKDSTVETRAKIAAALRLTKDSVDHQLSSVYAFFGVRSARGLFRCLDANAAELGN